MATILLFSQTSQRFYFFGENESMILLFGVSCGYDFTEKQKKAAVQKRSVPVLGAERPLCFRTIIGIDRETVDGGWSVIQAAGACGR